MTGLQLQMCYIMYGKYYKIFSDSIIPSLAEHKIFLKKETEFSPSERQRANQIFTQQWKEEIKPIELNSNHITPFLSNRQSALGLLLFPSCILIHIFTQF